MHYKIEGAIRKNRSRFIIFFILWLFMAIVFVAPMAYAQDKATVNGIFDFGTFVTEVVAAFTHLGSVMRKFWKLYCRIF